VFLRADLYSPASAHFFSTEREFGARVFACDDHGWHEKDYRYADPQHGGGEVADLERGILRAGVLSW